MACLFAIRLRVMTNNSSPPHTTVDCCESPTAFSSPNTLPCMLPCGLITASDNRCERKDEEKR